jgi:hypothetical protein
MITCDGGECLKVVFFTEKKDDSLLNNKVKLTKNGFTHRQIEMKNNLVFMRIKKRNFTC